MNGWVKGVIEYYLTLDVLSVPVQDTGMIFFSLSSPAALPSCMLSPGHFTPSVAQNAGAAAAALCAHIPLQASLILRLSLAPCCSSSPCIYIESLCCLFPIPRLLSQQASRMPLSYLSKPVHTHFVTDFSLYFFSWFFNN